MSLLMCLTNSVIPTIVGVNTISTTVLLALTTTKMVERFSQHKARTSTSSSPSSYVAAELLLSVENMRRDMISWSIGTVTRLPPNAKLREMQQIRRIVYCLVWIRGEANQGGSGKWSWVGNGPKKMPSTLMLPLLPASRRAPGVQCSALCQVK